MLIASGTVASQLIGVAVTPLLTRLFTPATFGILASYISILMTLKVVIGLRYEMAIPLATSDEEAISVMGAALAAVVMLVGSGSLFGWVVLPWLLSFEHLAPLTTVAWLLPLGLLAAGLYQTLSFWAIRERLYNAIAVTTLTQGFGRSLVQVAAGLVTAGPTGLVAGEIVGQGGGIVYMARAAWAKVRAHTDALKPRQIRVAAARFIRFPLMMAPASLLNSAGAQIPALLLATCYGTQVAGWYYVTQRLLALPVHLVSTAMGQVFLGEVAQLARNDPQELQRRFNTITRKLLIAGLAPMALLMLGAPWAIALLLGESWHTAGVYVQWLTVSFLLKFSYDGLINLALVERHDYALLWAAVRLILVIAAVLGANFLNASALTAVGALSLAFSVGYLMKLMLWRRAIRQLIRRHAKDDIA